MNLEVTYLPGSLDGSDAEDELSTELAELLGDGELLGSWQKHPASQATAMAPPAPVWDHWVQSRIAMASAAVAAAATSAPAPSTSAAAPTSAPSALPSHPESFNSYADAVIAGLSPDDEAVQLAHLAKAAGKTLQELLDFNYAAASGAASTAASTGPDGYGPAEAAPDEPSAAPVELPPVEGEQPLQYSTYDPGTGDYSFSADYCPRQRRLVLKDKEPEGPGALYGELSRWVDPAELERSLQEAAKRRNKPLAPSVLKKLKERKAATKALMKKKNNWLLS